MAIGLPYPLEVMSTAVEVVPYPPSIALAGVVVVVVRVLVWSPDLAET